MINGNIAVAGRLADTKMLKYIHAVFPCKNDLYLPVVKYHRSI